MHYAAIRDKMYIEEIVCCAYLVYSTKNAQNTELHVQYRCGTIGICTTNCTQNGLWCHNVARGMCAVPHLTSSVLHLISGVTEVTYV